MENLIVDIVIPTYRPDGKFEYLLNRLSKQTYPIRHIHVINTKSNRFPIDVYNISGIIISQIEKDDFDHGATRDLGIRMSDADIVIFMTQDAIPADNELIRKLVDPFADSKVGVSYARQLPAKECDVIERYTRNFNYPEISCVKSWQDIDKLGIKTFFCSNVCAAYKRIIYLEHGGFPVKTIFNEDMIMAGKIVRSGYKISYVAEAKVIHSHNYSCWQQFQRNFDLAVSQTDHTEVFGNIKSETEGIKLVKQTAKYLLSVRKPYLIPLLIYKSGWKYLGYKLGQNYKKLPQWLVLKCTMNTTYWGK